MTDEQISEIYAFGRDAFFGGQRAFQVQAYPFRMTPVNMAKHRNNPHMPFWKMIKEGYDHFEVTRTEPKVDVCEKRYVFNAQARGGASTALSFSASAKCPDYEVAPEIMAAVRDKQRKDEVQTAELIRKGTPAAPVKLASDGGMHQNFAWKLSGGEVRDAAGNIRGFQPGTAPGVIRDGGGPFRSAEPEAPTGTVVAATAPSRAETAKAGPEPKVRVASAGPADAEESPGMFGRMKSTMGRWIGLGGSEAAPEPAKSKPEPKPARTARPAPKPAEPEKAAPSAPKRAPEKPLGEPEVRSAAAAPPAAAPSAPAAMSGSQPVVPSSSFESRWSFR
jgi:hypothetical protein